MRCWLSVSVCCYLRRTFRSSSESMFTERSSSQNKMSHCCSISLRMKFLILGNISNSLVQTLYLFSEKVKTNIIISLSSLQSQTCTRYSLTQVNIHGQNIKLNTIPKSTASYIIQLSKALTVNGISSRLRYIFS